MSDREWLEQQMGATPAQPAADQANQQQNWQQQFVSLNPEAGPDETQVIQIPGAGVRRDSPANPAPPQQPQQPPAGQHQQQHPGHHTGAYPQHNGAYPQSQQYPPAESAPYGWPQPAAPERSVGAHSSGMSFAMADGSGLLGEHVRASEFVEQKKIPSSRGWRKWLYRATFGAANLGESPDEQLVRQMQQQVAAPLLGTFAVMVLGGKGGVGKTTTTVAIGSCFAALRPREQVVAIDADPGQGANLAARIDPSASSSYSDIVAADDLVRYSDMRARVGHNDAGLDVVASGAHRSAGTQASVSAELYNSTRHRLDDFYNIQLTDCGVDIQSPIMAGVLDNADALVMVTSAIPDGAEGAAKQMDWLAGQPKYRHLLDRMVLVINHIRTQDRRSDRKATQHLVTTLVERFGRWISEDRIIVMPYDRHVAKAGVIDPSEMAPLMKRRVLEATAALAISFPTTADAS